MANQIYAEAIKVIRTQHDKNLVTIGEMETKISAGHPQSVFFRKQVKNLKEDNAKYITAINYLKNPQKPKSDEPVKSRSGLRSRV